MPLIFLSRSESWKKSYAKEAVQEVVKQYPELTELYAEAVELFETQYVLNSPPSQLTEKYCNRVLALIDNLCRPVLRKAIHAYPYDVLRISFNAAFSVLLGRLNDHAVISTATKVNCALLFFTDLAREVTTRSHIFKDLAHHVNEAEELKKTVEIPSVLLESNSGMRNLSYSFWLQQLFQPLITQATGFIKDEEYVEIFKALCYKPCIDEVFNSSVVAFQRLQGVFREKLFTATYNVSVAIGRVNHLLWENKEVMTPEIMKELISAVQRSYSIFVALGDLMVSEYNAKLYSAAPTTDMNQQQAYFIPPTLPLWNPSRSFRGWGANYSPASGPTALLEKYSCPVLSADLNTFYNILYEFQQAFPDEKMFDEMLKSLPFTFRTMKPEKLKEKETIAIINGTKLRLLRWIMKQQAESL